MAERPPPAVGARPKRRLSPWSSCRGLPEEVVATEVVATIIRTEQEASNARARRGCEMRRARGSRGDVGDDEGDIRPPESQADGGVMQSSGGVLAVGEKTQRTLRRGGRAAGVPNIEDSAGNHHQRTTEVICE